MTRWEAMDPKEHNELFGPSSPHEMTGRDRSLAAILLVETESSLRTSMRQALISLGFDNISDAPDHSQALDRLEQKNFTHVIFDARGSTISGQEFLATLLERAPNIIAVPSSHEPSIDEVFQMLIAGAKGYIAKPFTAGSLDEALAWATKGDPVTDAIRHCRSRNEALATLALVALDRLALVMRQSDNFETARLEIPQRTATLHRAVELGSTFAEGGARGFQQAIIEAALERGSGTTPMIRSNRRRGRRRIGRTS